MDEHNRLTSDNSPATEPQPVHVGTLHQVGAISAVGLVAAGALRSSGVVSLMINQEGFVELVPAGELELDRLPEPEALQELVSRDYTDNQLASYLLQRDTRAARKETVERLRNQEVDHR